MKRVKNNDNMPAVETELLEQSDGRLKEISSKILQNYGDQFSVQIEPIEIFLMQVHLETAKAFLVEKKGRK